MNSSQLTDIRRLQSVICSLQKQTVNSNYYTNNNDIIPNGDLLYDIGSSNDRFNSLYLGYGTLYMGDPTKTSIDVNYCNVLYCKPGLAAPYIEFANSNYPTDTESIQSGIHVYYNVGCNDLWKRYPDGTTASFGTVRGETGPQGPTWQFSNDLLPQIPGLNIGAALSNVNNLFLSNAVILNGASITSLSGHLYYQGNQVATSQDFTNGVSTISSITSYGLSTVAAQPNPGVSSLSSIVSYGLSTVAAQPNPGVSSLSSIVSYGLSSFQTTFSGPGTSSLSSILSYGLSSILNSNTQQPYLGGVLRVDSVYGNDANAPLNKYQTAFKTITTAMANTSSNDFIQLLPGTYNESIVFSNYVSVRGVSINSVTIQQTNVTSNTVLVTMASNTRLEDVTLNLTSTSSNAQTLVGILFSNVNASSKIRACVINVNNSAMTCNVPTNVYGLWATGTSATTISSADTVQRTTVNVTSSGPGRKCGIYQDGQTFFSMRDVNIYCTDNSSYSNTSNGFYCGSQINNSNGILQIKTSTSYGLSTVPGNSNADISQTLGQIILAYTDIPHKTANGYGFSANSALPQLTFGIGGLTQFNTDASRTYLVLGTLIGNNNSMGNGQAYPSMATFYPINPGNLGIITLMTFQLYLTGSGYTGPYYVSLFKSNTTLTQIPGFTLSLSGSGSGFLKTQTSNISVTFLPTDQLGIILSNTGGVFNKDPLNPVVTLSYY